MSKAKVSELLLEALNRCLPLTAEDDKGCGGCPYEKICAENDLPVTVGIPAQLIEDIRGYLSDYMKETANGKD